MRDQPARKLFADSDGLADLIKADDFKGMDADSAKAAAGELINMVRDLGAGPDDARLVGKAIQDALAGPMTDAQRADSRDKAVAMLNQEYGDGARRALMDARAFIARDPRMAAIFSRIGDHPDIVMMATRLAQAAKSRR